MPQGKGLVEGVNAHLPQGNGLVEGVNAHLPQGKVEKLDTLGCRLVRFSEQVGLHYGGV